MSTFRDTLADLPTWLQNIQVQQAQDRDGKGQKITIPDRAVRANQREVPPDMPVGAWMNMVWDMMAYLECGVRTAKIETYKAVTGQDPPEHLKPWEWYNDGFWRTDD